MKSDLSDLSNAFDIALISAGGWGHIILHHIRHNLTKSAIYVGGYLSIHFGLISHRILTTPSDSALLNEHFMRPELQKGRSNIGGYL